MTITKLLKRLDRDLQAGTFFFEDNGFAEQMGLLDKARESIEVVRADLASLKGPVDMDLR